MKKSTDTIRILDGKTLSATKGIFSASSKRFINAHKEDIMIIISDEENVMAFYGESNGSFVRDYNGWIHDYGNLYKSKIVSKIVNELMSNREVI